LKNKLKEEVLKHKVEEKACKAALKAAKLLNKQSNKPTRRKQSKHISSMNNMPDVIVDNLKPDVITDDPLADVVTDNLADETCSDREILQSKNLMVMHSLMQRDQKNADNEIDVNKCCVCFGVHVDNAGTGKE